MHIAPFRKFHRIGGSPPKTSPNVKYDAPAEVGGNRNVWTALLGDEVLSKLFVQIVTGP